MLEIKIIPLWLKKFAEKMGYKIDYSKDGCDLRKNRKCYLAKKYSKTITVTAQQYLGAWRERASLLVIKPLDIDSWDWEEYSWSDWFQVIEGLKDYLEFKGEKIKLKLVKGRYYNKIVIPVDALTWKNWLDIIKREKMPRIEVFKRLINK